MNARSHADSPDLTATIDSLHAMLAASERRYASMAKFGRWVAIAFVAFVVLVASVGFNLMNVAQAVNGAGGMGQSGDACNPADITTMQTQKCALQQVSTLFMTLNQLMTGMVQTPRVQEWMQDPRWSEVLERAKQQFLQMGLPEAQAEAMARQVTFGGMVAETVVNAGLLVNRIAEDSDAIREATKDRGGPIGAISHELSKMNVVLAAIPAMATEMNVMNRQMSVMAYGVGSTMGRMGNVLPW